MRPYLAEIARIADCFVSCYPNAGLPNAFGEYDEAPDADGRRSSASSPRAAWSTSLGGCCGTTPEHIAAIAAAVDGRRPAGARRGATRRCGCPASSR